MNNKCAHCSYVAICRCFIAIDRQIRLVGGTNSREGRVEVRNGCYGNWGTVCDDLWDSADARTTCYQLGYTTTVGAVAYSSARFGQGTGDILNDLKCSGRENSLFECPHDKSTVDCRHDDDAGASCPRKQIITIV